MGKLPGIALSRCGAAVTAAVQMDDKKCAPRAKEAIILQLDDDEMSVRAKPESSASGCKSSLLPVAVKYGVGR